MKLDFTNSLLRSYFAVGIEVLFDLKVVLAPFFRVLQSLVEVSKSQFSPKFAKTRHLSVGIHTVQWLYFPQGKGRWHH